MFFRKKNKQTKHAFLWICFLSSLEHKDLYKHVSKSEVNDDSQKSIKILIQHLANVKELY